MMIKEKIVVITKIILRTISNDDTWSKEPFKATKIEEKKDKSLLVC